MKVTIFLFLVCFSANLSFGQNFMPYDEVQRSSPATDYYKQQITDQVLKQLNKIDWNHVEKKASSGSILYTIPVVVHVLHNYGPELVADTLIYHMMDTLNSYFLKTNPDTVEIIDKFKGVAANTQIAFKLATLDPNGNRTKGVEHIYTYLTYDNLYNSDQAKLNQWPQERYLNIWVMSSIGPYGGYASTAYDAAYSPYYDGVAMLYGAVSVNYASRWAAKYLNLPFPCSCCGPGMCEDADGIADTPPCSGYDLGCDLYDTICDTPNDQNLMSNYSSCGLMFTYGQGQYMQNILQLDFGNRDSLVTPFTYAATGMDQPMPDMPPVADFSFGYVSVYGSIYEPPNKKFYCQGQSITFENHSWNDTIIDAAWSFSNNALLPASTSLTSLVNKFYQPGWVTVSLAVTGNNTGTSGIIDANALFIADSVPTDAARYVQEFAAGSSMDKWPMFNYYNNAFKWQLANTGYFDNTCLEYNGYDLRTFPQNTTGTPEGDIDDIYTPSFDLTGFTDSCYFNFMSSGATATSNSHNMHDSLEIDYSINESVTWNKLTVLKGDELDNKGTITTPYKPLTSNDWVPRAISLPSVAITDYTLFRFRYYPGADSSGVSTGNNFYLDHFNFSGYPEQVMVVNQMNDGVSLLPNPTRGNSYIVIKGQMPIQEYSVIITDITGKIVYEINGSSNTNIKQIEIPQTALILKGMYLVHVVTGSINQTEKLVVY